MNTKKMYKFGIFMFDFAVIQFYSAFLESNKCLEAKPETVLSTSNASTATIWKTTE
tara:strand:+ start:127 stop:294 length:168 start_codon:yes stop_codon:yes gene_type:complete